MNRMKDENGFEIEGDDIILTDSRKIPLHIYKKAVSATNTDEKFAKLMKRMRQICIEKWCTYFVCEERQKNGKKSI